MHLAKLISTRIFLFFIALVFSNSIFSQDLTTKQLDSAFLAHPFKDRIEAFKKSIAKKVH